jgi:hypothetical protein
MPINILRSWVNVLYQEHQQEERPTMPDIPLYNPKQTTKGITLNAKQVTYDVELETIREIIAEKLEVPPKQVTVKYIIQEVGGDYLDRSPGTPQVTKIQVVVNAK